MLTPSSTVVQTDDHLAAELGDELVMLNPTRGTYFSLGATGTRIWGLIAQPTDVASVCKQLVAAFAVDPAQCTRETLAFLEELQAEGLIRCV